MDTEKKALTIVQNVVAYDDYVIEAIDSDVLHLLNTAATKQAPSSVTHKFRALVTLLECFLQITEMQLTLSALSQIGFETICKNFIGALQSPSFLEASYSTRHKYCSEFKQLLRAVKAEHPKLHLVELYVDRKYAQIIATYVEGFAELTLNDELVWLWRGWRTENRSRNAKWLPLYPVYKRMGRDFTQGLYLVCDQYYRNRNADNIYVLRQLSQYIYSYPDALHAKDFKSPLFMTHFWRKFLRYYMITGYHSGGKIEQLSNQWRCQFTFFACNFLTGTGFFAEPFGAFPGPIPKTVAGHRTNIKKRADGTEVNVKLLTDVPLHVTDKEALEILFKRIGNDVRLIVDWARWAAADIWKRHRHVPTLASYGEAKIANVRSSPSTRRQWHLSRDNPDRYKHAAATFLTNGFTTKQDGYLDQLYPLPLTDTAHKLALTTTAALLPHCILLVAAHPQITPAFLSNLALYDKNGQRSGFLKLDKGFVLESFKPRKGSKKSQQVVHLNVETNKIVSQIIALTVSAKLSTPY